MRNIILCLLAMCLWAAPAAGAEKKELTIVYVEWDCATASSYLVKAVLEDRLGYKVELLPVTMSVMWASVASGDADATVTAWLPETHRSAWEKAKDKVEKLGKISDGARLGLAVPDYVPLKSITELTANSDKFNKRIIGIDPGAGIMTLTETTMKEYKIDNMELVEGSGALMTSMLENAIRAKEWVVVTAWSPHWMFGRWPLHYLEDPKGTLGTEEQIFSIGRKGLKDDHPEAHAFLSRFHYSGADQLQVYMSWNQQDNFKDPMATARRFMKENPELVATWFEDEKATGGVSGK